MSSSLAGSGLPSETTQKDEASWSGRYGNNRTQWKPSAPRDSVYLSEWASRMGQARANANAANQLEQSCPRYVPPHARDNGSSGYGAYRSIGEEGMGTYKPPWQRSVRAGSVPGWGEGAGSEWRNRAERPVRPERRSRAIPIVDPANTHCPVSVPPQSEPPPSSPSVAGSPRPIPGPSPTIVSSPPVPARLGPASSSVSPPPPPPPPSPPRPTLVTLAGLRSSPAVAALTQASPGPVSISSAVPSSSRAAPLQPVPRPPPIGGNLPQPIPRSSLTTATSPRPRPSPVSLLVRPSPSTVTVSPNPRPALVAPANPDPSPPLAATPQPHLRPAVVSDYPSSPAVAVSPQSHSRSRPVLNPRPYQAVAGAAPQSRPRPDVIADPLPLPNVTAPPPPARQLLVLNSPPAAAAAPLPLPHPTVPGNSHSSPAVPAASRPLPRSAPSANPTRLRDVAVAPPPSPRPSRFGYAIMPSTSPQRPRPVRSRNTLRSPAVAAPPQPDRGSRNSASSGPIPPAAATAPPTHAATREPASSVGISPTGVLRSFLYAFTGIGRPAVAQEAQPPARPPSPMPSPNIPSLNMPPPMPSSPSPPMRDMEERRRLLGEAASLMELCTNPDIEQDEHERTQLLNIARETLLQSVGPREEEVGDTVQGNAENQAAGECVVCCDEMADTVLVPCGHLAMCSECCDAMGINERGARRGVHTVRCPICRTDVEYRIKIFKA